MENHTKGPQNSWQTHEMLCMTGRNKITSGGERLICNKTEESSVTVLIIFIHHQSGRKKEEKNNNNLTKLNYYNIHSTISSRN